MNWGHFDDIKILTSEKSVLQQPSACGPLEREAHSGGGLLAGFVSSWGTHTRGPAPEGLCPVEGTQAGAVPEVWPVGRSHTGEVHGGLSPVGGSPA